MKALAVLIFLLLVVCVAYLILVYATGELPKKADDIWRWITRQKPEWKVREVTRNSRTQLYLSYPGEPMQPFGEPISMKLSEFEYSEELTERRVGAQERCDTLNRRLSA